jgi:hypothetical protein
MYSEEILRSTLAADFGVTFDLQPTAQLHASWISTIRAQDRLDPEAVDLYDDMLLLDTAELGLVVELSVGNIPTGSVQLTPQLMQTAAEKLMCIPSYACLVHLHETPQAFDVVSFVGDGLKALDQSGDLTGEQWQSDRSSPTFWADAVRRVEDKYRDMANFGRYGQLLDAGVLRVQGALWATKAELLFGFPRVNTSGRLVSVVQQYQSALNR